MEVFTLEGLRKVYEKSIDGLTKTQIQAIESDNEEMTQFFPRMRQARVFWERLQEQKRLQSERAQYSPILFLP